MLHEANLIYKLIAEGIADIVFCKSVRQIIFHRQRNRLLRLKRRFT